MRRTLISAILLILLCHLRYFSWLIVQWRISFDLSLPILVVLNSVLFFYLNHRKQQVEPRASPLANKAIALLLSGSIIWIISLLSKKYIWLAGISLPLVIHGILCLYLKRWTARTYIFPIYILILLIPIHQLLKPYANPILKEVVINGVAFVVKILGIGVFRNGFILGTENYSLQIIDECSGLEGLTVSLFFGALIAYITQETLRAKTILFLSVILLIFFANILRIAGIVYVGTLFGNDSAAAFFHGPSNLIIYTFIYSIIFLIAFILRKQYEVIHEN